MKRKIHFKAILTGVVICGLATNIIAKDIRDVLDKQNIQGRTLMRAASQTWVYHTNGDLWMGWDSYGNTGDQTCSAIIPGWVYPGSNQAAGHGYLKKTAEKHSIFRDISNLSTYIIPRSSLPVLPKKLKKELGFYYTHGK